jgi:hypothetical protein
MVAVARLMNATLVVPVLDHSSFWADPRYIPPQLFQRHLSVITKIFCYICYFCYYSKARYSRVMEGFHIYPYKYLF